MDAYERIYASVDSIPCGQVATYGMLAREADLPGRARQVGNALRRLPEGSPLPWHRVVNAAGGISARAGEGGRRQRKLLREEGVGFDRRGRVKLKRFLWRPQE